MAKINSTTVTITVSQLVRDDEPTRTLLDGDMLSQLEAVIGQLAAEGPGGPVIVEVRQQ